MNEEKTHIARISQNGHETGFIRLDQSIEWLKPLQGRHAGQEKFIESIAEEALGSLAARGAIMAALELQAIFKSTEITIALLVDTLFGTEPDVIN